MGKQRRTHILEQAVEIARLIHVPLSDIRVDSFGVLTTPEQMDKLIALAKKKTTSDKHKNSAA